MKKAQIIDQIFVSYFVAKKMYEEKPYSEYLRGCESQAWHVIFMADLADAYFKWESENAQYYN